MHIPDGYLSPQTYIPMYAAMVPIWAAAARKVQTRLRSRQTPLLAMGAAFSFVLMMFNIPAPGGTTGHAVGGALIAILLGPWAACVAISMALAIQAIIFGDGGITALGANCFTMAVVMPFTGYYCYRFICGGKEAGARRRIVAGFVAGYVALNAAALYTGLFLGIQPLIASGPDGRPLYAPYPLSVAVPAMAVSHLLIFGFIEGLATALVIRYMQRTEPSLLKTEIAVECGGMGAIRRLSFALGVLLLFTPLGVIVPALFKSGSAWGEWSPDELGRLIGFVPEGMKRLGRIWEAPLPDYTFGGWAGAGAVATAGAYLVSALAGTALTVLCIRMLGRILTVKEGK